MNKYLVISYDDDEQQTFYDWVQAVDEEMAMSMIAGLRPYVISAVCAITPKELREMADRLEASSEQEINSSLNEIGEESGEEIITEEEYYLGWHKGPDGLLWYGSKGQIPTR